MVSLGFLNLFLFSDGKGRHEHQRKGGGACLCFWPRQGFTKRVAAQRGLPLRPWLWQQSVKPHLQDLLLDIPVQYRGSYFVTSGHKVDLDAKIKSCQIEKAIMLMLMQANHKFEENNAVLVTALHPLLGKVGAVVVIKDMEAGEEVESTFLLDLQRPCKKINLELDGDKKRKPGVPGEPRLWLPP